MKRHAFGVLFVLVICATLANLALATERLTAGYSSISPTEWTLVTASKANLFEKHGLDVPLVYLGGSTRIVQVMIAGDIQIGQIGGSAALFGKAASVDMAYIATTINGMAAQVLSRPEIKMVAELKGKAIGVTRRGSNTDYWARFGLTHHGLVPDKDVKIVYTGGLRETYTALQQKQIAAATMGLGNAFGKMLQREGFNTLMNVSGRGFSLQRHCNYEEVFAIQTPRRDELHESLSRSHQTQSGKQGLQQEGAGGVHRR